MLGIWTKQRFAAVIAMAVAVTTTTAISAAEARSKRYFGMAHSSAVSYSVKSYRYGRYTQRGSLHRWAGVLQCVPFARENSGIELTGNAGNWWNNAEGLYERGARPEVGSILNFRASGRMRLGHVAVVTQVVDSRRIEIDHANWSGPGRISRSIDVVDVSPANDWTAVRVALGASEDEFGSVYPTYGFIYDRPDTGAMTATAAASATASRTGLQERLTLAALSAPEEVAEAADESVVKGYAPRRRSFRYHGVFRPQPHGRAASATIYRVSRSYIAPAGHHHRRF